MSRAADRGLLQPGQVWRGPRGRLPSGRPPDRLSIPVLEKPSTGSSNEVPPGHPSTRASHRATGLLPGSRSPPGLELPPVPERLGYQEVSPPRVRHDVPRHLPELRPPPGLTPPPAPACLGGQ
eukprot:689039-Pyramimonas_sp.AAC.1